MVKKAIITFLALVMVIGVWPAASRAELPEGWEPLKHWEESDFAKAPEGFPEGYWDGCCPLQERDTKQEAIDDQGWEEYSDMGPGEIHYDGFWAPQSTAYEEYINGYTSAWVDYQNNSIGEHDGTGSNYKEDWTTGYQDGIAEAKRQKCKKQIMDNSKNTNPANKGEDNDDENSDDE